LSASGLDGPSTADNDGQPFTSPVGSYDNASWCGALDMVGNVLQWCADAFEPYPQAGAPMLEPDEVAPDAKRVQRGGSFLLGPSDLRAAARRASKPGAASLEFGMRLAFTPRN
jgi:toxoflavin biosynthesis protein ToxD